MLKLLIYCTKKYHQTNREALLEASREVCLEGNTWEIKYVVSRQ